MFNLSLSNVFDPAKKKRKKKGNNCKIPKAVSICAVNSHVRGCFPWILSITGKYAYSDGALVLLLFKLISFDSRLTGLEYVSGYFFASSFSVLARKDQLIILLDVPSICKHYWNTMCEIWLVKLNSFVISRVMLSCFYKNNLNT